MKIVIKLIIIIIIILVGLTNYNYINANTLDTVQTSQHPFPNENIFNSASYLKSIKEVKYYKRKYNDGYYMTILTNISYEGNIIYDETELKATLITLKLANKNPTETFPTSIWIYIILIIGTIFFPTKK